ncbi:peptidoglycan-binding protein [Anabaena sp. UHCC 0399]|uniref:peptidoglycan-binding protein n=1 Tax=Anabaena sp. UHCC 0399 TaxID=3110238 RepID=UPI002B1F4C4B|nr:peptidoglycan-binding protein [Anabaena sp. UHCC 0399]MEA5567663.1 peptidoglycan-binding protein [Anabaena sp. UHCC 0399]
MRLYRSSILIITYFSCLGFYLNRASATTTNLVPKVWYLAQVSSARPTKPVVLTPGSQGLDVQNLQTQLTELGYYDDLIDGKYGQSTKNAVVQFQTAKGLKRVDGFADLTTQKTLQAAFAGRKTQLAISPVTEIANSTIPSTTKPQSDQRDFIWWLILGLGTLGSIGAILFLLRWYEQNNEEKLPQKLGIRFLSPAKEDKVPLALEEVAKTPVNQENTAQFTNSPTASASISTTAMPVETTSRITKLSIVDELIRDLRSTDPSKRHKAIWDLGQQGDSRAIQPLVNLLIDADSQQRSLILASLSEINIRTLKPINRALAVSMQDDSPKVRQNAIRDLTRVYDMMGQMSQMLNHALDDPDSEVQATARYALTQMNRMRNVSNSQISPGDSQDGQVIGDR